MATVGLDRLYYSKITESITGDETYATPQLLAKAISADLEIELNEATLFADDSAAEVVKYIQSHGRPIPFTPLFHDGGKQAVWEAAG